MTYEHMTGDQLWNIFGSFGQVNGTVCHSEEGYAVENGTYHVRAEISKAGSVFRRKDFIRNLSQDTIYLDCATSRFVMDAGEYEVYTQANTWQNESKGAWQSLVTGVCGETIGVRNAFGATPFLALWNKQTNRGRVFHILTKGPWRYQVRVLATAGEANQVELELGVNYRNFHMALPPQEAFCMPEILYYDFQNKLDMDSHILHEYLNRHYPRKAMPVMYNTWLYRFDRIDFENVSAQVERAKMLGVEYFVIDAGWFGQGNFWDSRGDWYERTEGGFGGRMGELSRLVRDSGMKFGLWLEIETAGPKANCIRECKEHYFTYTNNGAELYFLDFAKESARDYMFSVVSGLIDTYQLSYIKFDFNQDLTRDDRQEAFCRYFQGYDAFIRRLKDAYPELYLENCASGGQRMTLANAMDFDGFWLSDNQSPYEGMRIYKDSLLRLPPQSIERWATIQSVSDMTHWYQSPQRNRTITTNDGTWSDVRGLSDSYLAGFLTGGPIGFSCDLNSWSEELFLKMKEHVVQFKEDRAFFMQAVVRILADTDNLLVLEYSDVAFERVEVLVFTNRICQSSLTLYPVLDPNGCYRVDGKPMNEDSITIPLEGNYTAKRVTFRKVHQKE
ncbi:MAG: alpha-galactosidase [Ruminococcaceae bacterium]|nr:alpha-galactosidase [Oscillospiraceae bacterium]